MSYEIKTVNDLIEELKKHDGNMPVKKLEISPMDIANVKVQKVNKYAFGGDGKIESTYEALVIR